MFGRYASYYSSAKFLVINERRKVLQGHRSKFKVTTINYTQCVHTAKNKTYIWRTAYTSKIWPIVVTGDKKLTPESYVRRLTKS